jgi:BRCT domain type II-containing protein
MEGTSFACHVQYIHLTNAHLRTHLLTPPTHSRVVGQPSSKTDYAILGEGVGPSKLAAIKKHGLLTPREDQFLNLLATRKGPGEKGGQLDEKAGKKM